MKTLERIRAAAPTLSVGVLTADWMHLEEDLARLDGTGVEVLHFDVMDGAFAPLLTLGPPIVKAVKTPLLKDVHLMVREPLEALEAYAAAGADLVTVHVESCVHALRALQVLGGLTNANDPARGIVRGIGLDPGTPVAAAEPLLDEAEMVVLLGVNPGWGGQSLLPSTFRRIEAVRALAARSGREILLCVDGGIKRDNIAALANTGVDLVVTGSAVFDGKDPAANARLMLERLRKGEN